ncbi:MAG: hypothetical protein DRJ07_18760 [Bacteroidetes bacterium]|nr:MAG: hypothetical protein DRJ07_18760 [Bacteroidota bacterium]
MKKVNLNTIHPKELITLILGKIYKAGNTTTPGGNISIRDEKGDILVTSGIDTVKDFNCVRTIPESWIFHQDVMHIKYGDQFASDTEIADKITLGSLLAVIENDSVVAVEKNLTLAFDRLEIGEFSAKSLVMGNKLGEFIPISEKDVEDLRKAFLQ